jgi:hypothetical protein
LLALDDPPEEFRGFEEGRLAGVGDGDGAVTSAVTRGFESSGAPHDKHNRAVSGTLFPQEAHLAIGSLPFALSPALSIG